MTTPRYGAWNHPARRDTRITVRTFGPYEPLLGPDDYLAADDWVASFSAALALWEERMLAKQRSRGVSVLW